MTVPRNPGQSLHHTAQVRLLAIALLLALTLDARPANAKGPEPPERILLAPLGLQPPPTGPGALANAAALTTVHFIDDRHLLITFGVRRLMKRLPDCPPDDQDRTIDAVIVELPTGKVVARSSWRVHDASPYLWSLGHGRFLLRVRDTLTTFVPLVNLPAGDPFTEQPFLKAARRVEIVILSPDADLITIETTERPVLLPGEPAPVLPPSMTRKAQINFYRLLQPVQPDGKMIVQAAGAATSKGLLNLSITTAGYIEVLQESSNRWLFDFDPYAGKFVELSPFDSTCRPRPVFVSASEFVAFGCRGSDDRLTLGGFNLHGEQMWQQNFTDTHAFPNFAFAPEAGRFALSRNIVASTAGMTVDFAPSNFTTQEIRVYEIESGRQLLRLEATPVQRFGQNYALAPDALRVAIIRGEAVEVYRLPPPTDAEKKAHLAAQKLRPEDAQAYVTLAAHAQPAPHAGTKPVAAHASVADPIPEPAPLPVAPRITPTSDATSLGDPANDAPRKPPTLYTLPTDPPKARPD